MLERQLCSFAHGCEGRLLIKCQMWISSSNAQIYCHAGSPWLLVLWLGPKYAGFWLNGKKIGFTTNRFHSVWVASKTSLFGTPVKYPD